MVAAPGILVGSRSGFHDLVRQDPVLKIICLDPVSKFGRIRIRSEHYIKNPSDTGHFLHYKLPIYNSVINYISIKLTLMPREKIKW